MLFSSLSSPAFLLFPSVLIHFPSSRSGSSGCFAAAFLFLVTSSPPTTRHRRASTAAETLCGRIFLHPLRQFLDVLLLGTFFLASPHSSRSLRSSPHCIRLLPRDRSSSLPCNCCSSSALVPRRHCHLNSKRVRPLPSLLSILHVHVVAVLLPGLFSFVLFLSKPLCLDTLSCVTSPHRPSRCSSTPPRFAFDNFPCALVSQFPQATRRTLDTYTRFGSGPCSSASNFSLCLSIVTTSLLRRSPSIFGSSSLLPHGTAKANSKLLRFHLSLAGFQETVLVSHKPFRFSTMTSAVVALTPK